MTEAEWLTCDADAMLAHLGDSGSSRKRRLFACACVRRVWKKLVRARSREGVEVAERYADGLAGKGDLSRACKDALNAAVSFDSQDPDTHARRFASSAAYCTTKGGARFDPAVAVREANIAARERDGAAQAKLGRCVFGNPFRPVALDPARVTPAAADIALAAYEERALPAGKLDPVRLAILADALEEAGCFEEALLAHLRSAGPHVRGCWALDLILGKE